jgi:hypothetical protein
LCAKSKEDLAGAEALAGAVGLGLEDGTIKPGGQDILPGAHADPEAPGGREIVPSEVYWF